REVLRPALVPRWVLRAEAAEREEILREPAPSLRRVEAGEDALGPFVGRPRADRPALPPFAADARHLGPGAEPLRALRNPLGRQAGGAVELALAHDLDCRHRLGARGA